MYNTQNICYTMRRAGPYEAMRRRASPPSSTCATRLHQRLFGRRGADEIKTTSITCVLRTHTRMCAHCWTVVRVPLPSENIQPDILTNEEGRMWHSQPQPPFCRCWILLSSERIPTRIFIYPKKERCSQRSSSTNKKSRLGLLFLFVEYRRIGLLTF